jgi:3-oxoacyl-[acyl-carrier protein] reductase
MKNKNVIITGGTRGIGAAIAQKFIDAQANVIVTGLNKAAIISMQKHAPSNVKYIALDLSCSSSVRDFCLFIDSLKNLDVLVNNAGINKISRIDEIEDDDFEQVLSVNLRGPFYLSRHAAKKMKPIGGKIVNIASIWSVISKEGRVSYSTAKSALGGLTRGLSADMAQYNVLVNSVSPGFVKSDLTIASLSEDEILKISEQIPAKRMAEPAEIANVVEFLCSDNNSYVTGQNIVVDGGFTNV